MYIPFLDADFIAFDGFSFINAKFLHTSTQIHVETPHHFMILRAYLYSWFSTSLPIMNYIHEYLIHGSIGYVIYLYMQSVFSEEEAAYMMVKAFDTVIQLEKFNYGEISPIAYVHYPEKYEVFHPWFGAYLVNKSVALFHIIENQIGSMDPLRLAIQQLLRSPSLIKNKKNPNGSAIAGHMSPTSPSSPTSPTGGAYSSGFQNKYTSSMSPSHYASMSPAHYTSMSPSHYTSMSPSHYTSMSPSHYGGYYNQFHGHGAGRDGASGAMSPALIPPSPLLLPNSPVYSGSPGSNGGALSPFEMYDHYDGKFHLMRVYFLQIIL